jgi:hypothetical protein
LLLGQAGPPLCLLLGQFPGDRAVDERQERVHGVGGEGDVGGERGGGGERGVVLAQRVRAESRAAGELGPEPRVAEERGADVARDAGEVGPPVAGRRWWAGFALHRVDHQVQQLV